MEILFRGLQAEQQIGTQSLSFLNCFLHTENVKSKNKYTRNQHFDVFSNLLTCSSSSTYNLLTCILSMIHVINIILFFFLTVSSSGVEVGDWIHGYMVRTLPTHGTDDEGLRCQVHRRRVHQDWRGWIAGNNSLLLPQLATVWWWYTGLICCLLTNLRVKTARGSAIQCDGHASILTREERENSWWGSGGQEEWTPEQDWEAQDDDMIAIDTLNN